MAKKGQKFLTYTKEFKMEAVNLYLNKGMGYERVTQKLNLPNKSYVQRWVKNYRNLGMDGLEDRRGKGESFAKGRPLKKEMTLEEENKRLRAENDYLKKLWAYQRGNANLK